MDDKGDKPKQEDGAVQQDNNRKLEVEEEEEEEGERNLTVLNLDTIPVEVLLQIFKFVDATDLLRRVSLVSKYFYNILSNEMTWKIKQEKRWGSTGDRKYPPVDLFPDDPPPPPSPYAQNFTPNTFPWSRACVKREEQIKLWSNNATLTHSCINSHIGCIDSIHLFTKNDRLLLACGSRDRTISVWNVEQVLNDGNGGDMNGAKIKSLTRAHDGWIWDFCVSGDKLFSCSWDTSAKIWDLNCDFQVVGEFKSNTALLSISSVDSLTAIGTFNRKTLLLDPRTPSLKPISTLTHHTRSVLSVGMDSNYLITCGEDGLVCKHDLRANKLQKSLKLPSTPSTRNPYPTCSSFRDTRLNLPYFYVGDNSGSVHLIDLLNFEVKQSHKLHDAPVRGVFNNLGSVLTCSKNGKLNIRDPSAGLRAIGSVDVGDRIELPCVHSLNNVVACGGGDGVVRVWGEMGGV